MAVVSDKEVDSVLKVFVTVDTAARALVSVMVYEATVEVSVVRTASAATKLADVVVMVAPLAASTAAE